MVLIFLRPWTTVVPKMMNAGRSRTERLCVSPSNRPLEIVFVRQESQHTRPPAFCACMLVGLVPVKNYGEQS